MDPVPTASLGGPCDGERGKETQLEKTDPTLSAFSSNLALCLLFLKHRLLSTSLKGSKRKQKNGDSCSYTRDRG